MPAGVSHDGITSAGGAMGMGTTVAGSGTVTLTWPAPDAPREEVRQARAAELVCRAGRLAREVRDQLVLGAVRTLDRDLETITRERTVHHRPPTPYSCAAPGLTKTFPLSPSMEGVLRLAAVTTTRQEESLAQYWRIATLLRPFAARGEGLGAGETVRFEPLDFPSTLTHEPTRRFLREVGLPEDGSIFELDTELSLPTLPEYYEYCAEMRPPRPGTQPPSASELPPHADRLIRLGHLWPDTHLVVDGTTGTVLTWTEPDRTLRPLNADIPTLAFTVWLVHRREKLDADYDVTPFRTYLTAATMPPAAVPPELPRTRTVGCAAPGSRPL